MAKAATTTHLADFADDHGVTIRTVTNWLADGMPYRNVRGERRVVRREANAWLLDRAKRKAAERERDNRWDKDIEMAKKTAVERRIKEVHLARLLGDMLPVDEFDALADRLVGGFAAVASGQLQPFERRMGLPPEEARALTMEIHEALMRGAQQLADELEADADAIAAAAAELEEAGEADADEEADELVPVDDLEAGTEDEGSDARPAPPPPPLPPSPPEQLSMMEVDGA